MSLTPPEKTDPMLIAWELYKITENYNLASQSASRKAHVDSSLRASFCEGWTAYQDKVAEQPPEIARLTRELAVMKKDVERLDYMQKTCLTVDFSYGELKECVWIFKWPSMLSIGGNVRTNIDKAMETTEKIRGN